MEGWGPEEDEYGEVLGDIPAVSRTRRKAVHASGESLGPLRGRHIPFEDCYTQRSRSGPWIRRPASGERHGGLRRRAGRVPGYGDRSCSVDWGRDRVTSRAVGRYCALQNARELSFEKCEKKFVLRPKDKFSVAEVKRGD